MNKKIFKKLISLTMAAAITLSFTACGKKDMTQTDTGAKPSSQQSIEFSSEFPSSTASVPSHEESSDVASVVAQIESSEPSSDPSSTPSSKPPAKQTKQPTAKPVSQPTSSATPSSETPSSAPPSSETPSSNPPSSETPSSTPPPPSSITQPPVVPVSVTKHDEMRAVWIAFLEFDSFDGSSEQAFTDRIANYFDTAVAKGLNTVIVQIRPHGDSMYESQYYPWSKHVSGTMGQSVPYDPTAIMVQQAKQRSLEIHAWINPYRTMTDKEMTTVPDNFPTKMWYNSPNRGEYMVKMNDGRWWLKPGNSEVQQLIINGATEIVSKYQVDGVHIDDYFYGGSLSAYGDSSAQAKANTTAMVKGLHDGIKAVNPNVRFGVSPVGSFTQSNALPSSDMGYLSTDLAKWCTQDGYIDYVMPQIYWEYDHKTQPFTMTLNKWENFVTAPSVSLYVGLAPYKLSQECVKQQMADINASSRSSGYALFRYDHIVGY